MRSPVIRVESAGAEGLGALGGQLGNRQDVGGGVQVALRVAAHQFPVFGEGHVAFDDAGAHAGGRDVGLPRVLGKLQGRTAVADGKVALFKRALSALLKRCFKMAFLHVLDQVIRSGAELHVPLLSFPVVFAAPGKSAGGCDGCKSEQGD